VPWPSAAAVSAPGVRWRRATSAGAGASGAGQDGVAGRGEREARAGGAARRRASLDGPTDGLAARTKGKGQICSSNSAALQFNDKNCYWGRLGQEWNTVFFLWYANCPLQPERSYNMYIPIVIILLVILLILLF
jgi:hypothetical protein